MRSSEQAESTLTQGSKGFRSQPCQFAVLMKASSTYSTPMQVSQEMFSFLFFFFFSVPTHAQTFFSSGGFRGSMSKTLDYCTIGLDRAKSSNKGNQEQGYGLHHFKENQGLFLHHGSIQREIDLAVSQRDEWMSAERMQE